MIELLVGLGILVGLGLIIAGLLWLFFHFSEHIGLVAFFSASGIAISIAANMLGVYIISDGRLRWTPPDELLITMLVLMGVFLVTVIFEDDYS